jgi:3-dehydroquinate synthetase
MNDTWKIKTSLSIEYEIKKTINLFDINNLDLLSYGDQKEGRKRLLVVDSTVNSIYHEEINNYFNHHKINYRIIIIDGGESQKNLENLLYILSEFEKFGIQRKNEPIIGIGGGVVLDIVGLASTLYRRGIPYIRIPTTLLGIIDVSVAAKTGINFEDRRNRLGSYYPPIVTFLDKKFIQTLPDIEISSGLGEIIKMGVIKDTRLFELLENYGHELFYKKFNTEHSDEVIDRSITGMKEELENNLWEKNLMRCVDFGHSFSPIIEMKSLVDESVPTLTHGQAVTLDVIFSSIISYYRGMLDINDVMRIINTSKLIGLPTYHESFTNPHLLLESLNDTIKHRNGSQNLPIPTKIGEHIFINDFTFEEIKECVKIFKKLNNE